MSAVSPSHQLPTIIPTLPDYCIRVAFKCQTCPDTDLFEFKRCDKAVQSNTWYHACEHAITIKVASQASMCKDCWGLADGLGVPIWKALYQEGQKISDAFLKTFENLGRLGFRIRGAQHRNVRVKGTIVWIKRLEGEIQGVEGYFPWRASLDSLSDEIVKPKYLFGGQMSIASALEDGPECVEIIRQKVFEIKEKTDAARKFLDERGFMIEGEFLGLASESHGDAQADTHRWGFLQGNEVGQSEDDDSIVVWNGKNGKAVKIEGVGK
ncbi:uncharacterized protein EAE98_001376 [Botrytis deweyae]|uniref:Uncharacterized protein n=1 Tax=Botrytis deweyae TaxID=2478750 RepID=A0ABQ7J1B5_9HELO|nr:uncharacterized protein EAE98_001376 [Botrytis deweyae]KAF7939040.1 hypothetical protein EAE98_001376 [Botrytis deweyae]